jgi:hypothetical protein
MDVGNAYRLALVSDEHGAFNVAAEPVLDPATLAQLFDARRVHVAPGLARFAVDAAYRLRLQPTPPGWLDLALGVPLLDCGRALERLDWMPLHSSTDALLDLLKGLREGDGIETPPLASDTGGPLRVRELLSGVGARDR